MTDKLYDIITTRRLGLELTTTAKACLTSTDPKYLRLRFEGQVNKVYLTKDLLLELLAAINPDKIRHRTQ